MGQHIGRFSLAISFVAIAVVFAIDRSVDAQTSERSQLSLKVNIDVAEVADLVRADEFLADQQWDEAVEAIRRVSENEGSKLLLVKETGDVADLGFKRYLSVREVCHMRLAAAHQSAPQALAVYRRRVDELARHWLEQAETKLDEGQLRRIVDQLFVSSFGDDALYRLGEFALERGEYGQARQCWERISPLLRTQAIDVAWLRAKSGQPLWLALRGIDFDKHWDALNPLLTQPSGAPAWLVYPDTDLQLSDVRARLVLVSILEGSRERAAVELELLGRLHPDAEGKIAGNQGKYVELLSAMLRESERWPLAATDFDWATFGGSIARTRQIDVDIDIAPRPIWDTDLLRLNAELELTGSGRPRIAEDRDGILSYHPLIVGDLVLWNSIDSVHAHRLHDKEKVWGSVDEQASWRVYPARPGDANVEPVERAAFKPNRRHVGVPRFTMTAHGHKLFARLGDPVTNSRDEDVDRAKQKRSVLVGLDLRRQGTLLPGFPIETDGVRWEFEGAPITDGSRLYVAMRHSSAQGALPELHVACFDLPTVSVEQTRRNWRVEICSAETPAGSKWDEYSHCLLSLHEGTIYCNTNVGAVAAISADDGQIKWIAAYPRAPMKPSDPDRNDLHYFRDLNPCICYKDLVIVAPTDCDRVFALDALTGKLVWENPLIDVVHLLGVGQSNLIASGVSLYWIDVNSGKLVGQFSSPGATPANGFGRAEPSGFGRGILAGGRVYWPTREQIFVFEQRTVQRQSAGGATIWSPVMTRQPVTFDNPKLSGGNLVIADGVMLVATAGKLFAFNEFGVIRNVKGRGEGK